MIWGFFGCQTWELKRESCRGHDLDEIPESRPGPLPTVKTEILENCVNRNGLFECLWGQCLRHGRKVNIYTANGSGFRTIGVNLRKCGAANKILSF